MKILLFCATEIDFNSHAHVERDEGLRLRLANFCHFNSHAHVERDPQTCGAPKRERDFNSHAHVERDFPPLIFYCI